jgi:hypothetical protein
LFDHLFDLRRYGQGGCAHWLLGVPLILVGAFLLWIALDGWQTHRQLIEDGTRVKGVVVDKFIQGRGSRQIEYTYPYADRQQQAQEKVQTAAYESLALGEAVEVYAIDGHSMLVVNKDAAFLKDSFFLMGMFGNLFMLCGIGLIGAGLPLHWQDSPRLAGVRRDFKALFEVVLIISLVGIAIPPSRPWWSVGVLGLVTVLLSLAAGLGGFDPAVRPRTPISLGLHRLLQVGAIFYELGLIPCFLLLPTYAAIWAYLGVGALLLFMISRAVYWRDDPPPLPLEADEIYEDEEED